VHYNSDYVDDLNEELAEAKAENDLLRHRILDAELALNVWDKGHDSEYWLRHPTPMSRT
jgi:hypothetical protein